MHLRKGMSRLNTRDSASGHSAQQGDLGFAVNIDPSKLRIPVFGSLTARPAKESTPYSVLNHLNQQPREEVTLEIHKSEALPNQPLAPAVTFPGWVVQVCVVFFGLILALSNLLQPVYTGSICLLASPSGMIGLGAHAFASSSSAFIAWGLISGAWLLPLFCTNLQSTGIYLNLTQVYLLWLSLFVFLSMKSRERVIALAPLAIMLLSLLVIFLANHADRLDPRWTVVVLCFYCFFICVYATRNSFRYNYTVRPLL